MLAPVAISIAAGFSGAIAAAASHSFETVKTHSERVILLFHIFLQICFSLSSCLVSIIQTEAYCSEEMGLGWLEAPLQLQLLSEAVDLYVPK